MTPTRKQRFNMLVSPEEDLMIRALADLEGLTASDFLRKAVRDAFRRYAKESGKTPTEMLEGLRDLVPVSIARTDDYENLQNTRGARVDISPINEEGFTLDFSDEFTEHRKSLQGYVKTLRFGADTARVDGFKEKLERDLARIIGTKVRLVDAHNVGIVGVRKRVIRFYEEK